MRFGIDLPHWGESASRELICRVVKEAEAFGFESLWVCDHLVIPERIETEWPYDPAYDRLKTWANWFEPLITLAYAAAETRSVRLGTAVILLPLRNPVQTAKELATLDVMSGGRLIAGVGVGWLKEEYEAVGAGALWDRRGAALTECIKIMRLIWTEEVASFSGEFYRLPPVLVRPKPLQQNGPPIVIGGNSKPALKRAGTLADGWVATHVSPDELAGGVRTVREFAAMAGRDPAHLEISVRCELGIGLPEKPSAPWGLYGPPELVRETIHRYEDAGCDLIILQVGDETPDRIVKMLDLFSEKILTRTS